MPMDYSNADSVSGSTANQGCTASKTVSTQGKTSTRAVKDVTADQPKKDSNQDMGPSGSSGGEGQYE